MNSSCLTPCSSERNRRTKQIQLPLRLPSVLFPCFTQCFFVSVVPSWIPLSARNSSSSCWSRGSVRSRTIPDCFWPLWNSPATRTTRCRPKMVLKRNSPPSWSRLWQEMDHHSSAPWVISPDPLQSPAHHLPAVRSISPSPPMTESHFPLRSKSQCKAERLSGRSSRKLSPTRQIRCESLRQCPPRGSQPWMM